MTFLYKVVLPSTYLIWIFFLSSVWLGHSRGWKNLEWILTPTSPLLTVAGLLGFWAWFALITVPLKKVEMDDTSLYVSNCRTEVQIPLSEITALRETGSYWFTIIVTFRNKTLFGQAIVFRPRHRIYLSGLNPTTRQLSELAEQARREAANEGQKDTDPKTRDSRQTELTA